MAKFSSVIDGDAVRVDYAFEGEPPALTELVQAFEQALVRLRSARGDRSQALMEFMTELDEGVTIPASRSAAASEH